TWLSLPSVLSISCLPTDLTWPAIWHSLLYESNMADYGPRAPHGPDMSNGKHDTEMDVHEKTAFDSLLRPADSYSPEGVYWTDMPQRQRIRYVGSYNAQEA